MSGPRGITVVEEDTGEERYARWEDVTGKVKVDDLVCYT